MVALPRSQVAKMLDAAAHAQAEALDAWEAVADAFARAQQLQSKANRDMGGLLLEVDALVDGPDPQTVNRRSRRIARRQLRVLEGGLTDA
jgi:hypothetical protein